MSNIRCLILCLTLCIPAYGFADNNERATPAPETETVLCGVVPGEFPNAVRVGLTSKAVEQDVCYVVMSPQIGTPVPPEGFPLLILLHGLHGGPGDWLRFPKILSRIKEAQEREIHPLPPMIVVVPLGKNGYWTNWNRSNRRWRDWVTHELLKDIETRFPHASQIPEKRAIAGYSMGGFGALSIALQYPGLFGLAIGLSPTDMDLAIQGKSQHRVYKRVFGKDLPLERIHRFNPYHQVKNGAGENQSFFIAFGSNEAAKFKEGGIRLTALMKERNIEVSSHEIAGGTHSFKSTWSRPIMESWLRWLSVYWAEKPGDGMKRPPLMKAKPLIPESKTPLENQKK